MVNSEVFKRHLWEGEIIEPDGWHSEFSRGSHGQKIDFDKIPANSGLFEEWVDITAEVIDDIYGYNNRPEVLVGVANGTNRLVKPVAKRLNKLGGSVIGLTTKKVGAGIIVLTPDSYRKINGRKPKLALVLEDVGTTGWGIECAASYTRKAGARNVEALVTWQRQSNLIELELNDINYYSVIKHILPTFTPEECRTNSEGYCFKGWKLNEYYN